MGSLLLLVDCTKENLKFNLSGKARLRYVVRWGGSRGFLGDVYLRNFVVLGKITSRCVEKTSRHVGERCKGCIITAVYPTFRCHFGGRLNMGFTLKWKGTFQPHAIPQLGQLAIGSLVYAHIHLIPPGGVEY